MLRIADEADEAEDNVQGDPEADGEKGSQREKRSDVESLETRLDACANRNTVSVILSPRMRYSANHSSTISAIIDCCRLVRRDRQQSNDSMSDR